MQLELFGDAQILSYEVTKEFDALSLSQKTLCYFLSKACYAGRDLSYHLQHRFNIPIREALIKVVDDGGEKTSDEFNSLMLYLKTVFLWSGLHNDFTNAKAIPAFSREWFVERLASAGGSLTEDVLSVMFDPEVDAVRTFSNPSGDLVADSAVNYYEKGITYEEVIAFYADSDKFPKHELPLEYGLNSKLVRAPDGKLSEVLFSTLYPEIVGKVIYWLEKAIPYSENDKQKIAFELLVEYLKTGDLKKWQEYNIAWVGATEGAVDLSLGFIEVYSDPLGRRGGFEGSVYIKDPEASALMSKLASNALWFETHAPILEQHRKKTVSGVSYKVVSLVAAAGDVSPMGCIGVNLPNCNEIRNLYGSKSVSLGNLENAHATADKTSGVLEEFAHDQQEIALSKQYSEVADKCHTALHEVLGHGSGLTEPGVENTDLEGYYSCLEEARADLFGLYFITDPKLVELGILPNVDAGKSEYDMFMLSGYLLQLKKFPLGKDIEEAHARDRYLIASWVLERGAGVVELVKRDSKTYIDIKDYAKLRALFGELLCEVQRIKSTGDYEAGKALVEKYAVKPDPEIHAEVHDRISKLKLPVFTGFANVKVEPVDDELSDFRIVQPTDFLEQQMQYAKGTD